MRVMLLSVFVCLAAMVTFSANRSFAQPATQEPAPQVDVSQEQWQVLGEPLAIDGLFYYPSGPTVFFDANVMARTSAYRGIPLYQDRTLEPYSILYVPIGGGQMRPYERRRTGELAGTTGSRAPSFPVEPASAISDDERAEVAPAPPVGTSGVTPRGGTIVETPLQSLPRAAVRAPGAPAPVPAIQSGIFIEFSGAQWYGSGKPMTYSPESFTPIGTYDGIVVYHLNDDAASRIWIPVVDDGPLAQYSRR